MSQMTPREIVQELDKHSIGQEDAKRTGAIALRNRPRRMQVEQAVRCIICQAAHVVQVPAALPLRVLWSLVTMVLPLPAEWFQRSTLPCRLCRHEWRPER